MEKIGRKKTLFLGMIGSGIFCIVSEFVGGDLAKTITFVIGKMLITIAFSCLYIYTIEVFPTNLRHRLFSICSVVGRIGSILAPLTPIMGQNVWSRLPLILFSVFALSSALFLCALPETLNKKLPDTVDEAFNWKQIKIFPHSPIKIFKLRKNNFFYAVVGVFMENFAQGELLRMLQSHIQRALQDQVRVKIIKL